MAKTALPNYCKYKNVMIKKFNVVLDIIWLYTSALKVAFFQKVRCVFQIYKSTKQLFLITNLNLKFKFPTNNSKQKIQISSSG